MQLDEVRSELSALWQAWLERVLAALQATGAGSTGVQAVALDKLQLLRRFLHPEPLPPLQLAEDAPPHAGSGLQQLCELLQCQARLRQQQDDVAAPGTALVLQALQQGLLKLAQACRHSDWTLGSCVATGLARQCRELTLLGAFAGAADLTQQLVLLEAQLLLWHAAAQAPSLQQQATLQKQLLALARGRVDLCRVLQLQAEPVRSAATVQAGVVQDECIALAVLLQPAQVAAAEVDATQMFACYRLAWILQAAERSTLAQVGLFSYQILVQHWQQRARLTPPVQHLLAVWLEQVLQPAGQGAELPGPTEYSSLLSLLGIALATWPDPHGTAAAPAQPLQAGQAAPRAEQPVLLALPARGSAPLSMRQLPEFLAASLSVLLQVEESWFVDRASWQRCSTLLYQELQLLEQGAAALRLAGLEHFCSLLLGLYAQVLAPVPQGVWPAALLWQAHQQLVALLDRAALWLEPVPNAATLMALGDWLQQGEERCTALLHCAAKASAGLRLASALTAFGQQAGRLLGRPVRICVDLPAAWLTEPATAVVAADAGLPDDLQAPLLRALQEILRWLLLQHESSAEQRRSRRQPLATVIDIAVQQVGPDACAVSVLERGVLELPGNKALQRLQRSLGPAVEALGCEELSRLGRRVQCSMSGASLQRAQDQRYRGERVLRQN